MSQDFKKVLVNDDRLMVTDSIEYGVLSGGQNVTVAPYNAISKSTSQLVFNIQVPSEQTIIDRRVMLKSTWTISITGTPASGAYLIDLGYKDALGPFPVHQLFTTVQATINNNTVNMNCKDVINALLRSNDVRELQAYNSMAPVAFDTYLKYSDAVNSTNNPLGSFVNVGDNDLVPRGAFIVDSITGNTVGDGTTSKTVTIKFTTTEPLLVSPFIFGDPKTNNQGFYGIQVMNFIMNVGQANRVWRTASSVADYAVSLVSCDEAKLYFSFITPHPSLLLPARNVVPYYEVPRYISTVGSAIPSNLDGSGFPTGAATTITANNIQLNQVPDKLIIFCRKQLGNQTVKDSDSFLPIEGIRLNWNNNSGLLATASQMDLYRASREAGSNQTFFEFSGKAWKNAAGGGSGAPVYTSGSMLMLDMGKHVQLTEDWYAPGSLGTFQLQFDISVKNYTGAEIPANTYEIVLITVNSGCFVCERGSSSIFTGILTKQDVLDAKQQEPISNSSVRRMIGGGWLDRLKTLVPKMLPVAKAVMKEIDHPVAKMGADVISSLGYGQSAGAKKLSKRLM